MRQSGFGIGETVPGGPVRCASCGKREGTIRWGDMLALTHGWVQMWCEHCAVTKQLEYARERAAAIPELEARLSALDEEKQ